MVQVFLTYRARIYRRPARIRAGHRCTVRLPGSGRLPAPSPSSSPYPPLLATMSARHRRDGAPSATEPWAGRRGTRRYDATGRPRAEASLPPDQSVDGTVPPRGRSGPLSRRRSSRSRPTGCCSASCRSTGRRSRTRRRCSSRRGTPERSPAGSQDRASPRRRPESTSGRGEPPGPVPGGADAPRRGTAHSRKNGGEGSGGRCRPRCAIGVSPRPRP